MNGVLFRTYGLHVHKLSLCPSYNRLIFKRLKRSPLFRSVLTMSLLSLTVSDRPGVYESETRGSRVAFLEVELEKADAGSLCLRNNCDDGPGVFFFLKIVSFF